VSSSPLNNFATARNHGGVILQPLVSLVSSYDVPQRVSEFSFFCITLLLTHQSRFDFGQVDLSDVARLLDYTVVELGFEQ
jgi:hypothetical protein